MQNRMFFFFNNIIRFNLIQRFKFSDFYKYVPRLNKIILIMHSHNWSSNLDYFVKTIFFFRFFLGFKPIFKLIFLPRKDPTRIYNVSAFFKIDLRRNFMFEFLELFLISLPRLKRKYVKIFEIYDAYGNHRTNIKDISSFFYLGENFFQWPYSLNIFFILKKGNNLIAPFIFRKHGFPLFN